MEKDFRNLLKLAAMVREAQADYFRGPTRSKLPRCKKLEAQLDATIRALLVKYPETEQMSLLTGGLNV